MLKVLLHPLAARFLKGCEKDVRSRVKKKLRELMEFPEERGKHLRYTSFWTLRIGDYRAVYEIRRNENKIVVLFIGHRDDVYDDFSEVF